MQTTISSSKLKAVINTFGAELHSLCDHNDTEYIWQANPAIWGRHAPVLFPFICNTASKKYTYNDKEYSLSNHGFARDSEFELLFSKDNCAEYLLKSNDETLKIYPFEFELYVNYQINENELKTKFTVKNTDNKDIYFFIGGHPAFKCPITSSDNFGDYNVEYEYPETITQNLNDGTIMTILDDSKKIAISHNLFANDVFMKEKPKSSWIALKSKTSDYKITLHFDNGGCIAVWSAWFDDEDKTKQAEFVCLEPWSSVPVYCDNEEDIAKMPHAIKLSANGSYDFSYTITIG